MTELYRALACVFPKDRISDDEAVLSGYAADSAIAPGSATFPSYVVLPKMIEEVRHLVQIADRFRIPVTPMARGSNIAGMTVPIQGGIMADLRLMNKIIEINQDGAYAVIEPGVTFHDLYRELKKVGFICHLPTAAGGSSPLANYLMRPSGNFSAKWDPAGSVALKDKLYYQRHQLIRYPPQRAYEHYVYPMRLGKKVAICGKVTSKAAHIIIANQRGMTPRNIVCRGTSFATPPVI